MPAVAFDEQAEGGARVKYQIIYADPPWSYKDRAINRGGALNHYPTMTNEAICALPVKDLAADDAVLFMWATFPKLAEGLDVVRAWGFDYKTVAFVWIKTNRATQTAQRLFLPDERFDDFMGLGRWTRANAEIVMLGTRGKVKRISPAVRQIIYAPLRRHSQKPLETRERITELVGDLPRVELFARAAAPGWDIWGNEVKSDLELSA